MESIRFIFLKKRIGFYKYMSIYMSFSFLSGEPKH